ncbi:MAG: triose-phosphate isomerase [Candidatus Diapherotrites archaeon]|nr:triose-phosphate isomerase [Candidatus Diapherotrites archaeon]
MELKLPVLFINFKTYAEATGKNAMALAKKAEAAAKQEKATIVLVVQAVDMRTIVGAVKLPVFAQHIDPIDFGSNTGHILPQAVKEAGAVGTVLNHAENKRDNAFLQKAIEKAKKNGLLVMACAETLARAKEIAAFAVKPDFIAVEPPELIGGDISVSTARPELITGTVDAIKQIAPEIGVVTGAGVKVRADAEKAVELGTVGLFVASGIIKAADPEKAIRELAAGLKKK